MRHTHAGARLQRVCDVYIDIGIARDLLVPRSDVLDEAGSITVDARVDRLAVRGDVTVMLGLIGVKHARRPVDQGIAVGGLHPGFFGKGILLVGDERLGRRVARQILHGIAVEYAREVVGVIEGGVVLVIEIGRVRYEGHLLEVVLYLQRGQVERVAGRLRRPAPLLEVLVGRIAQRVPVLVTIVVIDVLVQHRGGHLQTVQRHRGQGRSASERLLVVALGVDCLPRIG